MKISAKETFRSEESGFRKVRKSQNIAASDFSLDVQSKHDKCAADCKAGIAACTEAPRSTFPTFISKTVPRLLSWPLYAMAVSRFRVVDMKPFSTVNEFFTMVDM